MIYLCAKFQLSQTPATGFLPIDIIFFANIGLEYFSNNILRVFHQSQLELSDLDQNWAKTSPLLLQIFERTTNKHHTFQFIFFWNFFGLFFRIFVWKCFKYFFNIFSDLLLICFIINSFLFETWLKSANSKDHYCLVTYPLGPRDILK